MYTLLVSFCFWEGTPAELLQENNAGRKRNRKRKTPGRILGQPAVEQADIGWGQMQAGCAARQYFGRKEAMLVENVVSQAEQGCRLSDRSML